MHKTENQNFVSIHTYRIQTYIALEMSSDENYSDVSLDEEDEELIWRVFYGDYEKKIKSNSTSGYATDEEEDYGDDDEDELAKATDAAAAGTAGTANFADAATKTSKRKRDEDDDEFSGLSDIDDVALVKRYRELQEQVGSGKKTHKKDANTDVKVPILSEEERKRLIISSFTEEQMDRFESYRRMTVNKPGVKKICNSVLGHSMQQQIAVVLAGISKLFLGEIITRATEIQQRDYKARLVSDIEAKKKQKRSILVSLEQGKEVEVDDKKLTYYGDSEIPLQPEHIREAWRLYKLENAGSLSSAWRQQGDGDGKMFR